MSLIHRNKNHCLLLRLPVFLELIICKHTTFHEHIPNFKHTVTKSNEGIRIRINSTAPTYVSTLAVDERSEQGGWSCSRVRRGDYRTCQTEFFNLKRIRLGSGAIKCTREVYCPLGSGGLTFISCLLSPLPLKFLPPINIYLLSLIPSPFKIPSLPLKVISCLCCTSSLAFSLFPLKFFPFRPLSLSSPLPLKFLSLFYSPFKIPLSLSSPYIISFVLPLSPLEFWL